MSINLFPPEIHSHICQLACQDDGRTVRALSLVSKYFRQISRPYFYQSLSISGSAQITALDLALKTTPPHLRLVRHLFLSTHKNDASATHTPKATDSTDSASILRILSLCAPTLETLSFVSLSPSIGTLAISRLFRTSFPHLRELSISGFYPFPSAPGKMPSLQRLHLHGNRNPHGLLEAGVLDEACPSLTHLRVSGLSMATTFALELQAAFKGDDESPFPSKLPGGLRCVTVQPAPCLQVSAKGAANMARDQMMMTQLEKLEIPEGIEFTLLPRPSIDGPSEVFRREWSDRLGRI
ncbi:hypothetical protein C0992_008992 [Termitomyces sp. T32_za158]|nr:hypothetical protein C0992_008992 [Termitomyces sp. T32_za158]